MGLFSNFFENNNSQNNSSENQFWTALTSLDQLNQIVEESNSTSVLIFKHSTRCSISKMVLSGFERNYNIAPDKLKCYYLDLLSYREISNAIAEKFNVYHQSPQVLLIKDGKCVYDESHESIEASVIEKLL
jgi:bacillithiol system protein YtxJ